MAAQLASLEKFHLHTLEFLDFIDQILGDLRDIGEISTGGDVVATAIDVLKGFSKEDLINMFIDCHSDWEQVANRNVIFILETMPKTYSGIPFEVELLTLPLKKLLEYKEVGNFRGLSIEEQDDWVVNDTDLEKHWAYFREMIYQVCLYNHFGRNPTTWHEGVGFIYSNPNFNDGFPLEKYVAMFGFQLPKP